MSVRALLHVVTLAALVAAPAARAQSFSVEGFGGWQSLHLSRSSVGNAVAGREGTGIVGGAALVGLGPLGVGAVVDKTVSGDFGKPWSGAILAGFLVPLTVVRLEVLGELGRTAREFGDVFNSTGQTFVGFRPGVSFRVGTSPLMLGVSGIARWPTSNGDFGSPTYGLVGRVGLAVF